MGNPVLLLDSVYNVRIYPSHTISANEEMVGNEAFRVGSARRSTLNFWTPSTLNADAWNKARGDRVRTVNAVALDRGHNLAGKAVKLQHSDDDFTTTQTSIDVTLPSASAPASIDESLGVRTWEGAWIKRLSPRAASDHRLFVPAMGVGLKPQIVGLWLGMSWSPGAARLPFAPHITELVVEERESDLGWIGRGKTTPRRIGVLHFKFATLFDAELASAQLELYAMGKPMWIVPDEADASRAFLAMIPKEQVGLVHPSPDWMYPEASFAYKEYSSKEM